MKKILKFYSSTCGPCKVMNRILSTLKDIDIQEIDVTDENNKSLLDKWKVRTIPTVIILGNNNELLEEFKGITSIEKIQKVLNGGKTITT